MKGWVCLRSHFFAMHEVSVIANEEERDWLFLQIHAAGIFFVPSYAWVL